MPETDQLTAAEIAELVRRHGTYSVIGQAMLAALERRAEQSPTETSAVLYNALRTIGEE